MGRRSSDGTQGTRKPPLHETEWREQAGVSEVLCVLRSSAVDRPCDELTHCMEQSSPDQCLGDFMKIAMKRVSGRQRWRLASPQDYSLPSLLCTGTTGTPCRGTGDRACSLQRVGSQGEPQAGPEVILEPSLGSGCISYTLLQLGFSTLPVGPPRGQVGTVCTPKVMHGTQFVPNPI